MMRDATKKDMTDALRRVFTEIADYLIPATDTMPSASQMNIAGPALDKVMEVRPDLVPVLVRGLTASAGKTGEAAANDLNQADPEAFNAISKAASGGYYMDAGVRERLGYPGQEHIEPDDPYAPQSYVHDGSLKRVFDRGPIYVATPGETPRTYPRLPTKDMK